jgi:hypothetical protein
VTKTNPAIVTMVSVCAALVASCTRPSVRSAVYDGFGPNYSIMRPALGRPSPADPEYATNDFRYLPGSLTVPYVAKQRDDERHRAAVWRVNRSGDDCAPSPKLYTLKDVTAFPRLPVTIEYIFDTRNSLFPTTSDHVTMAKSDLSLGDNDIRYLRRISISFSNVTAYSASNAMLERARADILRPSRCKSFFYRRKGAVQIDSILAGDVFVEIDSAGGASVNLDRIKGKIYRALSRRFEGRSVFFAVSANPIAPYHP